MNKSLLLASCLLLPWWLVAADFPDAGSEYQDARTDWDLVARDISQWKRLPGRINQEAANHEALIVAGDRDPLDVILRRTRALLEDLAAAGVDLAAEREQLTALATAAARCDAGKSEPRFPLYAECHALNRRIALKNPLVQAVQRLVFVGHEAMPIDEYGWGWHMCDQYFGFHATLHGLTKGDGLYVLEHPAADHPVAHDLLQGALGPGGYLSPEVSFDGTKIAFAYTKGVPAIREWREDTCYHVYTCNSDGSDLQQLTTGKWNDFDPCYLPSGRIAFISERRGGFGRCHGRPVPTYTLHSMLPDGSDLERLSPHETNEWQPSVDHDGMILYTRWDYIDRGHSQAHHLWRTYPDGRDAREVNGNERRDCWGSSPMMEMSGRAIPGSRKYCAIASPHHGCSYGPIITVDPSIEDDYYMSQIRRVTPEQPMTEAEPNRSTSGAYGTPWPLSEKYYLCVYDGYANGFYDVSPVRHYSITLVDVFGNHTRLYTHPTISCLDPMPLQPRPMPPALPKQTEKGKPSQCFVADVYNSRLPFPAGVKVKKLRIWEVLPKFYFHNGQPRLGAESQQLARQCLGTVPVEEDGSAFFKVPPDIEFYLQALDENGAAIQTMRSGTYVHQGETLSCTGCHERRAGTPTPGKTALPLAARRAPSEITPAPEGAKPFNYRRLVQPVLDRNCVRCHGDGRAEKAPDLRQGDWRKHNLGWSKSFESIINYVHYFARGVPGYDRFFTPSFTAPMTSGANASPLYQMLRKGHHGVKLSAEDLEKLILFMDSNAQYMGHDFKIDEQRDGQVVEPPFE